MSVYKRPRKSSPEKLERAKLRAQRTREERSKDPEATERHREYMRLWNARNRETRKVYARDRARAISVDVRLKNKGLDLELKDTVQDHSGLCDICSQGPTGRWNSLNIDHCHVSGKFRGMLCGQCNMALGGFRDDPQLLRKAAEYLEPHDG